MVNKSITSGPPSSRALAQALLKRILSLWDSSLVDFNSRATPEPTQLLKNPKRYPLNGDTFFLLPEASRVQSVQSDCFGSLLSCHASPYKFGPVRTEWMRHEPKSS